MEDFFLWLGSQGASLIWTALRITNISLTFGVAKI